MTVQKMMQNWQKVILLILEILYNFYGIESKEGIETLRKEGIETLRTIFTMAHECLIFYCFILNFFNCMFLSCHVRVSE